MFYNSCCCCFCCDCHLKHLSERAVLLQQKDFPSVIYSGLSTGICSDGADIGDVDDIDDVDGVDDGDDGNCDDGDLCTGKTVGMTGTYAVCATNMRTAITLVNIKIIRLSTSNSYKLSNTSIIKNLQSINIIYHRHGCHFFTTSYFSLSSIFELQPHILVLTPI